MLCTLVSKQDSPVVQAVSIVLQVQWVFLDGFLKT